MSFPVGAVHSSSFTGGSQQKGRKDTHLAEEVEISWGGGKLSDTAIGETLLGLIRIR